MSELAQRASVTLTNEQLQYLANTEFVQPALRGNMPAIMAAVATGRSIGIDDMTALRSINMIDGKPTFSAELDVMLVRRAGHSIQGEVSEGSCTVRGKRADNSDEMSATWTLAMAERAGLLNKQNWKKYPEAMLWARAVTQLCRMLFADCFVGATYTAEELGDETTEAAAIPEPPPTVEDNQFPPVNPETGEIVEAGSRPVISDAQRTRLWSIAKEAGVTEDRLRDLVAEVSGVASTKLIPRDTYDELVESVASEVFSAPTQFAIPEGASGGNDS